MPTGIVKWFNSEKGFGFIVPDQGGEDIFVHISAAKQIGLETLEENTKLSYDLQEGRNGKVSAVNLVIGSNQGAATPSTAKPNTAASTDTASVASSAGGGISPVLYTNDLSVTETFYRRVMGFNISGEYEEDGERVFVELERQGVKIAFTTENTEGWAAPRLTGQLYIMTSDVDAVAASITSSSAIKSGPEDKSYGLRELAIEDPNGYILVFAETL